MGTQRARFEAWLKEWRGPRTPEEEAALLRVVDAYDAAIERNELSEEELTLIVDAASSKRSLLWENSTDFLSDLATRWKIAADAVAAMFQSSQSHVRFATLCCLTSKLPPNMVNDLLRRGLTDKSSRVRWKAAQKIGTHEKRELLAELESAFVQESNTKARAEIELHLRLLRDGYILKPNSRSGFTLTIHVKGAISSCYITDKEMQEKGVDAIVAELRGQKENFLSKLRSKLIKE